MTVLSRVLALLWAKLKTVPAPAWAAVATGADGIVLAAGGGSTIVGTLAVIEAVLIGVPVAVPRMGARLTLGPIVHDPNVKLLGRLPTTHDSRDLHLGTYLTSSLPTPPNIDIDNSGVVKRWLMLLNDRLGNCTIAAALHMIMLWRRRAGFSFTATNKEALTAYEQICGYDPSNPATDQGGVERDVLDAWRKTGIAGHKIGAYLRINPKSAIQRRIAVWLFGAVYLGVDLQVAQQRQTVWDYVPSADWGGHAVPLVAAGLHGGGKVITWGAVTEVTEAFLTHQCEEAWVAVPLDMLNKKGLTPEGFNVAQLNADLTALPQAADPAALVA